VIFFSFFEVRLQGGFSAPSSDLKLRKLAGRIEPIYLQPSLSNLFGFFFFSIFNFILIFFKKWFLFLFSFAGVGISEVTVMNYSSLF